MLSDCMSWRLKSGYLVQSGTVIKPHQLERLPSGCPLVVSSMYKTNKRDTAVLQHQRGSRSRSSCLFATNFSLCYRFALETEMSRG